MSAIEQLFAAGQYSLRQTEKQSLLLAELQRLTAYHGDRCEPYRKILEATRRSDRTGAETLNDLPFLPVRLFKSMKLQSVPDSAVLKTLTSSGTTSQQVSRIVVDKETAQLQTRALAEIVKSFIGAKRLPMIIIDSAATLKDPGTLSARGAGVVGLSNFGRDHFYALKEDMQLDLTGIQAFAEKHRGERILIFGFTFMVWQYFYSELRRAKETLALHEAILFHSGGWKKLEEQAVTNERFKEALRQQCGIQHSHNFYGMVEQVGSIYMECEQGRLHAPNFAEILIRDPRDWSVLPAGRAGVIQTFSVLPRSYPGHALVTEDLGTVHGVDDCPCGRKGTYFTVQGRIPQAELRGCSDTHAYSAASPSALDAADSVTQLLPSRADRVAPGQVCTEVFCRQQLLPSFDPQSVGFLADVSRQIFRLPEVNRQPELAALAFWLRPAGLTTMIEEFRRTVGYGEMVMPRGLAFHVAPSNVDTIFVYSWALSLLAGNHNIVRISQAITPQLDALLAVLATVLAKSEWRALAERNRVITYPHNEEINRLFSLQADVRIVWGGDATVQSIRSLPARPVVKDIVFADKVSHGAVHAERFMGMDDQQATALSRSFYNDAYQFDQMACSSPRCVYFVGTPEECRVASERFWGALARELQRVAHHESVAVAMDKLTLAYELATQSSGVRLLSTPCTAAPTVVHLPSAEQANRITSGGGFFLECFLDRVEHLAGLVQANNQTLTYAGWTPNEMMEVAQVLCLKGFDRVVPMGQALVFTPVWDGYVLLSELTRRVVIQ